MTKTQLKENIVLKKLAITLAVPFVGAVCFPLYWYLVVPQEWLAQHKLTWMLVYTSVVLAAWILSLLVVFIGMCWKNAGCSGMSKSQSTSQEDLWSEDTHNLEFTYTQPPPEFQTWATSIQPVGDTLATPTPPDEAWDFDFDNKLEAEEADLKDSESRKISTTAFKADANYLYRTFGYPGAGPGEVLSPEEEQMARRQRNLHRGSICVPAGGAGGFGEKGQVQPGKEIVRKSQKRRFSVPHTFLQFSKDDVFDLSTDEENMTPPEPACDDCVLARSCAEFKCSHPTSSDHTTSCVNCALSSSPCRAETLYECLVEKLQSPADTFDNETNVDSEDDNRMKNYENENLVESPGASEEEEFQKYLENVELTSEVWITSENSSSTDISLDTQTLHYHLQSLSPDRLQSLSPELFQSLSPERFQSLSPERFQSLSSEQLRSLSPEQLSDDSPSPSSTRVLLYTDTSPGYSDKSPVSDKKFDLLLASLQSLVIEIEKDFLESPRLGRRMSASADGITSARKDMLESPRLIHLGRRLSASTDDISITRRASLVKSTSNRELRNHLKIHTSGDIKH